MLLAFSVYTNTRKWLSTKTGSDNLGCLHGLRFLSMSWVVLCHTAGMLGYQANAHIFEILEVRLIQGCPTVVPIQTFSVTVLLIIVPFINC